MLAAPFRESRSLRTAIALRHVAFEDLDAFAPALEARDYVVAYREAPLDDLTAAELREADLLVVLGGPIGAYETEVYPFLAPEIALIAERLEAGRPVLGLCLGAQLMARALGATVSASGGKEIGWAPLVLSDAGRGSCLVPLDGRAVLHWHGDIFDLPAGAVHLASTALTPHQAFQWRRHGLALQFHLETTARGLERWYVGHAVELAAAGVAVEDLRAQAAAYAPELALPARAVLERWLDGLAG